MAEIVFNGVSFSYDKKRPVLKNINLTVKQGEYVAVVGNNGGGKTTLAKLSDALLIPDSGTVTVDGFSSADKKALFEIRKRVGLVFQNPDNQQVASIVEDDVAFGPENLGVKREEIGERIDFALRAVGMEAFRKCSPERLSGGQKQRLAIASVLAIKPQVLVLDESTAMLDPKGRDEVISVVEKLRKDLNTTVINITHFMEEAARADRVIVISGGEIIADDKPLNIFANKELIKTARLELPFATEIAEKLKALGVDLGENITDKERLKDALCSLKRKI